MESVFWWAAARILAIERLWALVDPLLMHDRLALVALAHPTIAFPGE